MFSAADLQTIPTVSAKAMSFETSLVFLSETKSSGISARPMNLPLNNKNPLRIGNGVCKQGYGNRPPIDDRSPIRKFSVDCLNAFKTKE